MNNQCIVYVTDVEYSFPTILSALQARKFTSETTDVLILLSEDLDNFEQLKGLLATSRVCLVDATAALRETLGKLDATFFQGRISISTMAKLVLCDVLPDNYTQIIYLDGDTQIIGHLSELETAIAPEGKFFAARDYTAMDDYLRTGIDSSYFNAGVLKFHRNGWIGPEALEVFLKHPDVCQGKHDQGALNYVGSSALIMVSNRWNFPKQFLHLANMSSLSIVHYMAHPKPWHGTFFPWSDAESRVYRDLRESDALYDGLYRGLTLDRLVLYKYRSILERLKHTIQSDDSQPRLQRLLVGDYVV